MEINQELAQLTLKNIQLIEQSYDVLAKLDEHFISKINEVFEDFHNSIQNKNGWYQQKKNNEVQKYSIWFDWGSKHLSMEEDVSNGYHLISTAIGAGRFKNGEPLQIGIHFGFNRDFFNFKTLEAREFIKEQYEKHNHLKNCGFEFVTDGRERRTIFLPFKFDLDTLVREYPDYETAFEPLLKALELIDENMKTFEEIAAALNTKLKEEYSQEQ